MQSVAISNSLPLTEKALRSQLAIEGRPPVPTSQRPLVEISDASKDYFGTMGVRLLTGRWFTRTDARGEEFVVRRQCD